MRLRLASAYHPQTDAQTERAHRTLEQTLRCLMSDLRVSADGWVALMPSVTMAINNTPADATGKAPNELVFGTTIATPVDHALHHAQPNLAASELATSVVELIAAARTAIERAATRAARYSNAHRRDVLFGVGERVLLATKHLRLLGSPKFRARFVGPFVVEKRVGEVSYRLKLTGRFTSLYPMFHVSQLAAYHGAGDASLPPPVLV